MTTKRVMTRAELIAALEAATGPSRELDVFIHCLKNPSCKPYDPRLGLYVDTGFRGGTRAESAPDFTESFDAAVSLVEVDCIWWKIISNPPQACVYRTENQYEGLGRTPAIALCSAALKAMEGKDG